MDIQTSRGMQDWLHIAAALIGYPALLGLLSIDTSGLAPLDAMAAFTLGMMLGATTAIVFARHRQRGFGDGPG